MSVANILSNVNQEEIDYVWLPPGGGPPATLATVLTAGNSAGCQLMTDVFKVEGCISAGTDFTLATNPANPNSDLYIANANAGDGVYVEAGTQLYLQTDVGAVGQPTNILLSAGQTVITPSGNYPYPGVVETGVAINGFNNTGAGNQQIGLAIDTITTGGECDGLVISNITSNNPGGNAFGQKTTGIQSDADCYGSYVQSVTSNTGSAYGLVTDAINGVNSTGQYHSNVSASQDGRGILVDGVNGGANAWGAEFNNTVAGTGSGRGVVINGVQGTDGYGLEIASVSGNAGSAYGCVMNGIASNAGQPATGLEIANVNGDGNGIGVNASSITSLTGRVEGLVTTGLNSTAVGADANGVRVDSVSVAGSGIARGVAVVNVTNNSGSGRAFGVDVLGVSGNVPAIALNVNNISTTTAVSAVALSATNITSVLGTGVGVSLNTIGGVRATGIDIANVVATGSSAQGIRVQSVRSTAVPAQPVYGGFFSRTAKNNADPGRLFKIFDGLLSLNTQYLNDPVVNVIQLDGGNLVLLGPAVPAPPAQVVIGNAPNQPPEDGDWLLISKQGAGGHDIADANGNLINGLAVFNFAGGSDMVLMFFCGAINEWVAHDF